MENDAERILGLDEWSGLSGLGMKREALSKARRTLKSRDMTFHRSPFASNLSLMQEKMTVVISSASTFPTKRLKVSMN